MATTKLRIKLASYDTGLIENVVSRILDTATKSGCKVVKPCKRSAASSEQRHFFDESLFFLGSIIFLQNF